MHPTIEGQLDGARRLIGVAESESELSPSSVEALTNARRLLAQVQRSWAALLPFYLADNERLSTLLARAGRPAPDGELPRPDDVLAQAGRNAMLRQQLAEVIAELPGSPSDDGLLAEITAYLIARVEADPS
jgi:hypothetical protein